MKKNKSTSNEFTSELLRESIGGIDRRKFLILAIGATATCAFPARIESQVIPSSSTQKKKTAWTLSTGDTEVTIGVDSTGQLALSRLVNPGVKWNWAIQPSAILLPTKVATDVDGSAPRPVTWRFHEAAETQKDTLVLTFTCVELPKLLVKSIWWAADSSLSGPVQHTFQIINETGTNISISRPFLDITVKSENKRLLSLWTFPDQLTTVGIVEHELAESFDQKVVSNDGNIGQPMPFVLIDANDTCGLYLGMEDQTDFEIVVRVLGGGLIRATAQYVAERGLKIPPRSSAKSSPTYLGVYQGNMEDGCNKFKRWFWKNKAPANHRNDPTTPWIQFGGMWTYGTKASGKELWWSDEATFRKGVEKEGLAKIGFEAVEVDAYWIKAENAGDWPSTTKIMGPLAHANGLKLVLYLMNEITWNSRMRLSTVWNEYGPDMWRNDFQNPTPLDVQAWAEEYCPKNYRFDLSPSSPDFKTMTHASVVDIYADNPDETRKAFYNLSHTLPPAQICILIHLPYTVWDKGSRKWAWNKDRFLRHFRSTLLGGSWIGVAAITPEYNLPNVVLPSDIPEMIPLMKCNLELYKSKIRPLIREGNLYHNIVDSASGFDGVQYLSPGEDCGAVLLFGLAGKSATIRCRRLKSEHQYQVTFTDQPEQNTRRTGKQLMNEGLSVTFAGTAQSEIILIGTLS